MSFLEGNKYKLGDLADITSSKRIFLSDYSRTGIPFYRSKEIIQKSLGHAVTDPLFITFEKFNEIKVRFGSPQDGDLLISAVGERSGIPYVVSQDGDFYFKDGNLIWFRNISNRLNTKYLYYWIKSNEGQSTINSLMIGSAQRALTIIGLKGLELQLPKIETQRRIASILSSLDDKIELNRQTNQTLEAIAQALFKEWFVDFNFPGATGQMQDSELGQIPRGWKVGKFFELCRLIGGGTPKTSVNEYWENGTIDWISGKDVTSHSGSFILNTEKRITELGLQRSSAKLLPPLSTVITARGTVGNYCIIPAAMAISQTNYALVSIVKNREYFLFQTVASLITELKQRSYGTVFDTITTASLSDINSIRSNLEVWKKLLAY